MEITPAQETELERTQRRLDEFVAEELEEVLPTREQHVANVGYVQVSEASRMLDVDMGSLPTWFSSRLRFVLGPIPACDMTIIAARPGCGKTSFMLAQARHQVREGHKVIYIGTEMAGARLRIQLAAQACRYNYKLVVQNRWSELPADAKERVRAQLSGFETEVAGRCFFTPEAHISHHRLMEYVVQAGDTGATLFVDHLHDISWGGRGGQATEAMSVGIHRLRDTAKEHKVRLFCAAQLRRSGSYDVLADYLVPEQSAIKQSGAIEEVSDTIVLLHRALVEGATEGELGLVRRGQKKVVDVVEPGTAVATVGKDRLGGSARDAEIRLYIENGELFDSPRDRAEAYAHPSWTPL